MIPRAYLISELEPVLAAVLDLAFMTMLAVALLALAVLAVTAAAAKRRTARGASHAPPRKPASLPPGRKRARKASWEPTRTGWVPREDRDMGVDRIRLVMSLAVMLLPLGASRVAAQMVTIEATDYAFVAPDTIDAGFSTFRLINQATQLHMAIIVQLDDGRTAEEFLAAYREAHRTGSPRPEWGHWRGGPGAAPRGHFTTIQYLEPGSYLLLCAMSMPGAPAHYDQGMVHPFVVRDAGGENGRASAPVPDVTIRMAEYGFETSASLESGTQVIRVENAGAEAHDLGLLRLAPGSSREDFESWIGTMEGPPPVQWIGGVAALGPGAETFFEANLPAGEYLLVCFVEGQTGVPHHQRGMVRQIRIQ